MKCDSRPIEPLPVEKGIGWEAYLGIVLGSILGFWLCSRLHNHHLVASMAFRLTLPESKVAGPLRLSTR